MKKTKLIHGLAQHGLRIACGGSPSDAGAGESWRLIIDEHDARLLTVGSNVVGIDLLDGNNPILIGNRHVGNIVGEIKQRLSIMPVNNQHAQL